MAEVEMPLELITEILTRLRVKPLCRFKCVSKSWNSLISSRFFIDHHFKSNPNRNIALISHHSLFSASVPEGRLSNYLHFTKLNLLTTLPVGNVNLIDSCNGILLVADSDKKTMFLCNPANNTYRLLPPIQGQCCEYLGFGYDSHADDYKVIKGFQNFRVTVEICVYSMRENAWKFIKDEAAKVQKYFLFQPCAVGANGVLYFVAVTKEPKLVLRRLDVMTEAFSIVDYPELDCYDFSKLYLWMEFRNLGGHLCLVVNYYSKSGPLMYGDVLEIGEGGKKASWVKLFRIQKSVVVRDVSQLVAYLKDKGKVLLEVDRAWFGWYDLVTNRVEKVKTRGLLDEDKLNVAIMYVESLVSASQQ